MLATSSIAAMFLALLFVLVSLGAGAWLRTFIGKISAIPARLALWWHARKLRKLDLQEAQARLKKAQAEAAAAEEAVDDANVKRLLSWLEREKD